MLKATLTYPGVAKVPKPSASTCGAGSLSVTAFHGCTTEPNTISWPGRSPRSRKPARSMSSRVNGGREASEGRPLRTRCSRLGRLRSSEHPYHRGTGQVALPDRLPREVRVCIDDDGVRLRDVVV